MTTYRVGNHQPQNVYRDDQYIGVMFTPEDAALVVAALNTNERAEAVAAGHLFGSDAHMIHGVHHKVGECTWPEMQCTGHPPRPDSAPNAGDTSS